MVTCDASASLPSSRFVVPLLSYVLRFPRSFVRQQQQQQQLAALAIAERSRKSCCQLSLSLGGLRCASALGDLGAGFDQSMAAAQLGESVWKLRLPCQVETSKFSAELGGFLGHGPIPAADPCWLLCRCPEEKYLWIQQLTLMPEARCGMVWAMPPRELQALPGSEIFGKCEPQGSCVSGLCLSGHCDFQGEDAWRLQRNPVCQQHGAHND